MMYAQERRLVDTIYLQEIAIKLPKNVLSQLQVTQTLVTLSGCEPLINEQNLIIKRTKRSFLEEEIVSKDDRTRTTYI